MEFVGNVEYKQGTNDIWGYVAPDGHEYALVGTITGVSVVDLENPADPKEIFFADGASSTWRDIKTHKGYAYVINESANGLMVIDLTALPDTIHYSDWEPSIQTSLPDSLLTLDTLKSCHNIYIDEFGYAYLAGCNLNQGGLIVADVDANPGAPEFVSFGPPIYSHDVYARENIVYSSEIYVGQVAIYDATEKDSFNLLGSAFTERRFTHNTWLSDDSKTLFTTDERANAPVGAYDISDPSDIIKLDQFRPLATIDQGVIPHNTHVLNDWMVISYYTDGCVIVDGSRPTNLIEVGNYDTYDGPSGGSQGSWGAYPFLPSGLILVTDRSGGLFVVRPNYVRAAWFEGQVFDEQTKEPINDVRLTIEELNISDTSNPKGEFATGHHQSGTYMVRIEKEGYKSDSLSVELTNGEVANRILLLEPIESNIDELYTEQLQLTVFPNPSATSFQIQFHATSNHEQLIVYDVHGKIVEQLNLTSKDSYIRIGEDYSPGVFFIQVVNGTQKSMSQRIVKL